ncbi:hypothetical protein X801_07635 [Opisthorchis viverrini]|uniref:Serpin domain-containing protein n=1 Tax=Opisthorchis viverrini TaxID=6198 RepID=A0A1S8WPV5_OPIVI|nr:hypothetical protein X801_07635 [Opisthorchis viverrini]
MISTNPGSWDHQFDKGQTQDSDFHCLNGESMKVQAMYRESPFYLADLRTGLYDYETTVSKERFHFGSQSEWALLILLPHETAGLPKLLSRLQAPGQLASALRSQFHMEDAHLYLPKFKLADQPMIDLKPTLYECEMKKLFDGGDLSRLSQSCLSLDEEGVTAAAAIIFTMYGSCRLPRTISVDHPFFIALVCDSTMPVFVGHVVIPKFD